ncbi:MAG TPA: hypothetical protein VFP65_29845, partial [Anaeromyxobacteraceae bacterium]|nr:hypothetical protein [Anaeromyxobacteraceae bacterium]
MRLLPLPAAVGCAAALAAWTGCAAPGGESRERAPAAPAPPAAVAEPPGPREALARFAEAVDAGRWDEAWPLLSSRWRERTTPALLARDLA